jgi:hypothetical protein
MPNFAGNGATLLILKHQARSLEKVSVLDEPWRFITHRTDIWITSVTPASETAFHFIRVLLDRSLRFKREKVPSLADRRVLAQGEIEFDTQGWLICMFSHSWDMRVLLQSSPKQNEGIP